MSTQQDKPYKYGVTAYNQGFYKFGPMEQCATGEWVKWNDIEPVLRAANLRVQTAMETKQDSIARLRNAKGEANGWRELYFTSKNHTDRTHRHNRLWRTLAVALSITLFGVVYYFVRIGA
jgi:hypothetical protein